MTDDLKSKNRSLLSPVIAVVVLLVGYPLSIGPAFWLVVNGHIPDALAPGLAVYAPFFWLAENWEWFEELLYWYIELWTPLIIPIYAP